MPDGVCRHRCRWARKASMLEGVAWIRVWMGNGFGCGTGAGASANGTGSPDERSEMDCTTSTSTSVVMMLIGCSLGRPGGSGKRCFDS